MYYGEPGSAEACWDMTHLPPQSWMDQPLRDGPTSETWQHVWAPAIKAFVGWIMLCHVATG